MNNIVNGQSNTGRKLPYMTDFENDLEKLRNAIQKAYSIMTDIQMDIKFPDDDDLDKYIDELGEIKRDLVNYSYTIGTIIER